MKILATIAACMGLLAGCAHAQIPPTSHVVNLSWTASTGTPNADGSTTACTTTGTNQCVYTVSRYLSATTITTCPTVNVGTPNYTPLNSASPTASLAYTDSSAAGKNACYTVQVTQLGATSQPSNVSGPFAVPGSPTAPVQATGTVAETVQPALPMPSGNTAAPVLTAKMEAR